VCSYGLASIRCVPQLPSGSVDFTTFTWPALLRRLKAMAVSGQQALSVAGVLLQMLMLMLCSALL
jgi:hypothetical protein